MTREQVRIGVAIRVIRDRWDVPAGTLAQVGTVGHAGRFGEFYGAGASSAENKRAVHRDESLNLFESDPTDFEVFTGPLPEIQYYPQRRRGRAIISGAPSPQLRFPYTADDFVSACLDVDPFPLVIDPLRDLYLDL